MLRQTLTSLTSAYILRPKNCHSTAQKNAHRGAAENYTGLGENYKALRKNYKALRKNYKALGFARFRPISRAGVPKKQEEALRSGYFLHLAYCKDTKFFAQVQMRLFAF